jgi:predicted nucleotidyltransferase
VLDEWSTVRAAWLFGSVATGTAGPLSDVEVGVLGCTGRSLDGRARLAADLGRAVGRSASALAWPRLTGSVVRYYDAPRTVGVEISQRF